MQPQRDQQPFQKAIQEHPGLAGGGDPPGKCADGPLHRRPKIAGPCAKQHRSGSLPQKGPPHPGVQLPCCTGEPARRCMVEQPGADKPQHHAPGDPQVHDLDAQHSGLSGAIQPQPLGGVGQQAQLTQGDVAGGQGHQIAHQGQHGRLLPPGAGTGCRNAHAQKQAEVMQHRQHPLVQKLPHQTHRRPFQHRKHLAQGGTGEQRPHCQQQPRRRKIGQRGQDRLGELPQCPHQLVLHGVTSRLWLPFVFCAKGAAPPCPHRQKGFSSVD